MAMSAWASNWSCIRALKIASRKIARSAASDEHASPTEPVAHPVDRLAFLEEARPPIVVSAGPADRPVALRSSVR